MINGRTGAESRPVPLKFHQVLEQVRDAGERSGGQSILRTLEGWFEYRRDDRVEFFVEHFDSSNRCLRQLKWRNLALSYQGGLCDGVQAKKLICLCWAQCPGHARRQCGKAGT